MSWKYIPAKINGLDYKNDYLRPYGYFWGEKSDSQNMIVIVEHEDVDSYDWYIVKKDNAFPYFTLSSSSINDVLYRDGTCYNGLPSYSGNHYHLFSSQTKNQYILMKSDPQEPRYSVDLLSGGLSGDFYYETGETSLGYYLNVDEIVKGASSVPIEAGIAGAIDPNEPATLTIKAKWDRWTYEGEEGDDSPAGRFVNEETGEELFVGLRSYRCTNDDSIWVGFNLSSKNAYWQDETGVGFKLRHLSGWGDWGEGWYAGNLSGEAWAYPNGLSTITENSFTVQFWEYDSEQGILVHDDSKDLDFVKGPYRLGTTIGSIYMGEVSLWR